MVVLSLFSFNLVLLFFLCFILLAVPSLHPPSFPSLSRTPVRVGSHNHDGRPVKSRMCIFGNRWVRQEEERVLGVWVVLVFICMLVKKTRRMCRSTCKGLWRLLSLALCLFYHFHFNHHSLFFPFFSPPLVTVLLCRRPTGPATSPMQVKVAHSDIHDDASQDARLGGRFIGMEDFLVFSFDSLFFLLATALQPGVAVRINGVCLVNGSAAKPTDTVEDPRAETVGSSMMYPRGRVCLFSSVDELAITSQLLLVKKTNISELTWLHFSLRDMAFPDARHSPSA